jgi:hypothetical protein
MRQVARRASLIVVLLVLASADLAASDDFNLWTIWSRNAAGEWTEEHTNLYGRRWCLAFLDLIQSRKELRCLPGDVKPRAESRTSQANRSASWCAQLADLELELLERQKKPPSSAEDHVQIRMLEARILGLNERIAVVDRQRCRVSQ